MWRGEQPWCRGWIAPCRVSDMGRRSVISALPDGVRRELDERLVASGFSDYAALAEWLQAQGFEISKSAVHRHGFALQADYDEAMADARGLLALTRASGDLGKSGSELARSASTLLQTDIVRTVLEIRKEANPGERAKLLAKLTQAQAQIGRMSIAAERWSAEEEEKLTAEAQAAAVASAAAEGLSPEQAARVGAAVASRIQIYLPDNGR